VTPDQIMSQFRALDEDVLSEVVMKIGFDRAELLESLTKQERNQMTVAYHLILDHKRRKMLGASPVMHATQMPIVDVSTGDAMAVGPDGAMEQQQQAETAAQQAAVAQQAAAAQHAQLPTFQQQQQRSALVAPMMSSAVQRSGADGTQRRWHLGVQSSLAPADMMLQIFRVLRTLRFEWKIVAQYSLKCRPCTRPPADGGPSGGMVDPSSMAVRCKVKVGLQLYKIQDDSYLLDIRKVDGDVLPFMDVCSLLLGELKL